MNRSFRLGLAAATLALFSSLAAAKSVPGDGATPVIELMPLVVKYDKELQLSEAQKEALAAYRKEAMPVRMAVQKKILALRAELRLALLDGKPAAEREALMQQIAEAEVEHFKGRERCMEQMRKTLSTEQLGQLRQLYLDSLR